MLRVARSVFCLLLLAVAGQGGAAHITDKLVVGLYPEPSSEGSVLRLLSSGTPLDVLQSRDGFVEVRLADELQGWVEASYVSEEKPAKAMLLETQARLRHMGLQLADLKASCGQTEEGNVLRSTTAGPASDAGEAPLRQALESAETGVTQLQQQLAGQPPAAEVQRRLDNLQGRVQQALKLLADNEEMAAPAAATESALDVFRRHRIWIGGLVALLLGFIAGAALFDYRYRKRHGGFRI